MLADVDAGSDTPSLVGKVLKWRKENSAEAKTLWDTIDGLNMSLSRALSGLTDAEAANPTAYRKAVKYISTIQSVQVRLLASCLVCCAVHDDRSRPRARASRSDGHWRGR